MKYCFVAHLNDLSGANKSLVDLACGLSDKNEVTVLVPRAGPLYDELKKRGVDAKIILAGSWVYKKDEIVFKKLIKRIINSIAEIRYYFFFKKNKFDVVHYNSFIFGTGARSIKKLNIPYTWHIRELPEENFNLTFFNKRKSLNIISNADKVITISHFMKNALPDVFKPKLEVVYNGIAVEKIDQVHDGIARLDELVIIGAVAEDKGQIDAIKAVKCLKEKGISIKLSIVGKITDQEYYKKLCEEITPEIKNQIIFVGYKKNVAEYRKRNQLALICSKAEAFGRVTIEAMAAGQIVIGANKGATPEIIQDGYNGFLYKQGDYLDLTSKILSVIHFDGLQKISINAFDTVSNEFSINNTVEKIDNILKRVVNERG